MENLQHNDHTDDESSSKEEKVSTEQEDNARKEQAKETGKRHQSF